jgi:hypothetical protein
MHSTGRLRSTTTSELLSVATLLVGYDSETEAQHHWPAARAFERWECPWPDLARIGRLGLNPQSSTPP